jgi:Mn-dependent DtxR family transcriptional regulator
MLEDTQSINAIPASESGDGNGSLKVLPPLTDKQANCLKFIHDYFVAHRYYPTQREVAEAMNLQSSTAETYLEPLRRKGYLHKRARRQRRNIRLTPKARQKLGLEVMDVRPVAA